MYAKRIGTARKGMGQITHGREIVWRYGRDDDMLHTRILRTLDDIIAIMIEGRGIKVTVRVDKHDFRVRSAVLHPWRTDGPPVQPVQDRESQ